MENIDIKTEKINKRMKVLIKVLIIIALFLIFNLTILMTDFLDFLSAKIAY